MGTSPEATGTSTGSCPTRSRPRPRRRASRVFDTVVFGRRTYELFEGFWRHAVVDQFGTIPDPHHPGRRSPEHGAIAIALARMNKIVFSRSMKDATWENSRLLRERDPREIETMKAQSGKDLIIFGSGSIVSEFTRHGLIDEYQFALCPVLLGSGHTLVRSVSKRLPLDLREAKRLPSGDVILCYARATRTSP
jgi:dihydrofolate reductase